MKNKNIKKGNYQFFVLLALSLFFFEETIRLGLSSIFSEKGKLDSMEKGFFLNSSSAEHNLDLARIYHMLMLGDEKKAQTLYVRSIELNPLLTSSWLGITEMFVENGEKEKALATLGRALDLIPLSIGQLWEASILALRLGSKSMALDSLRIVAKADPARRGRVFDICWQLIDNPGLILSKVVSDEILPSYLGYLISKDKLDETFPAWKRMEGIGIVSNNVAFGYIDYLIRKDKISKAFSIWSEMFPNIEDDSLVWNGEFENDPLGRGFDWKINQIEGVSIDFDWKKKTKGKRSLRLKFDGKHNVDFHHVSQVIPVEPDTEYLLISGVATQDITTRNGIVWEVYCSNMMKATEPLTGTTDWKLIELSFHTPPDCKSVVIRLRRHKSNKLDRYISGTAWVDDVKLLKVGTNTNDQHR
ncbi:hypothetical protein MYX76_05865 [Desulfobacterota bacterium AH_259_B03_O07]|nr:hypothetical protein [Desulfobacterota bacterium AH_259_B03_O07]